MQLEVLIQIMLYSFLIGFSGSITPGPVLAAVIKETPQRGWKTGPLVVFGHAIVEFALIVGLILGLDLILQSTLAELIISIIGGILLCVLASLMFIDVFIKKISITQKLEGQSLEDKKRNYVPIRDGIVLSITNPFWIVWWATIGIGLIYTQLPPLPPELNPNAFGVLGLSIFYIGHICADLSWYSFISIMITSGKRWINDKVYQGILTICAVFLIYLGVVFIINGINLW